MEGGRPARHHARFQDLEQLAGGRPELDRPTHVGHQPGPLPAAEAEQRDGHELAHLGRDVPALAQRELVEPVVGLDELGVLARRELPLRIHVAPRRLHLRDQGFRLLLSVPVGHGSVLW